MKKLERLAMGLGGLAVVLAIIFYLLIRTPSETSSVSKTFLNVQPNDISSVSVENEKGTYRFYYEGDGYVIDDIPGTIVDLDQFVSFMNHCATLQASEKINQQASNKASYGLENPVSTVTIETKENEKVVLSVGSQEKVSQNYYVQVEGDENIYLMDKEIVEPFLQAKTFIITKNATPPLALSSPLSAIHDVTFTYGDTGQSITIATATSGDPIVQLEALSFGSATHIVKGEGTVYQLDQTYGVEILGSLFGIPAKEVVAYGVTEEAANQLGFSSPTMTVEYDMTNSTDSSDVVHCVLKLIQQSDGKLYSYLVGSGVIYEIEEPAFFHLQYEKCFLRWFLTPLIMDLDGITVEGQSGKYVFTIDNTDVKNPIVQCNGQEVDITLFRSFFRLLTSAAHDGNYLGKLSPSGSPVLRVTYSYNHEGKKDDVMELYPGATRRANVFVNGAGEFAMKDTFVDVLMKACQDLLNNQPIDENW